MLVDINFLPKKEKKRSLYLIVLILFILLISAASFYMWHLYSNQMEIKQKLQTELDNVKVEKVTLETKIKESNSQNTVDKLTTAIEWANNQHTSTYSLLRNIASLLPERG